MATTASETAVQELYISYFGRPADPEGLAFYADALDAEETTVDAIATSFATSTEAQAIIALDTDAYLTAVYLQAFGRAYDNSAAADGTFWFDAIESEATTKELAMVQILAGAQGTDITAVANKVAVSQTYTAAVTANVKDFSGDTATAAAKAVLDDVTSDADTVTSGNTAAAAAVAALASSVEGSSFTLTTTIDAVTGGAGDDSISGSAGTLDSSDLDGGIGDDLLSVTLTNADDDNSTFVSKSIETMEFRVSNGNVTLDLGDVTGLETLTGRRLVGDLQVDNLVDTSVTIKAENTGTGALLDVNFDANSTSGSDDSVSVTVDNSADVDFDIDAIETLTITGVEGSSTIGSLTGDAIETVNVTGDQDVTISVLTGAGNLTVSAADMTGDLDVTLAAGDHTVTGGTGDDTINMATTLTTADVIDGGDGTDTLELTGAGGAVLITELDVTSIEALQITTGGTDTADMSFTDASDLTIISAADAHEISVTNLATTDTISLENGSTAAADVIAAATFALADATGIADSITLNLTNNRDAATGAITLLTANDIETVSLAVSHASTINTAANQLLTITTFDADAATTLNLSGATGITIGAFSDATLTTINGSTVTGDLNLTLDAAVNQTVTGGSGDDTFAFGSTLTTNDTIDGGDGDNTITFTAQNGTTSATVSNTETILIDFGVASATVSGANFTGVDTITVDDVSDADISFSNLKAEVTTVQLGSDATDGNDGATIRYASGVDAAHTVIIGDETDTPAADVTLGVVTVSGNAGALTISSEKFTGNDIFGITANTATALTITTEFSLELDAGGAGNGNLAANAALTAAFTTAGEAFLIDGTQSLTEATDLTFDSSDGNMTLTGAMTATSATNLTVTADRFDFLQTGNFVSDADMTTIDLTASGVSGSIRYDGILDVDHIGTINLTATGGGNVTVDDIELLGVDADLDDITSTINISATGEDSSENSSTVLVSAINTATATLDALNITTDADGTATVTTGAANLTITTIDATASLGTLTLDTSAIAAAVTINTGSGTNTITTEADLVDTIVLADGVGTDSINTTEANDGADLITNFEAGADGDIIRIDLSNTTVTNYANTDLTSAFVVSIATDDDGVLVNADDTVVALDNMLLLTDTFADIDAVFGAIDLDNETNVGSLADNDELLVIWTDGADSFLSKVVTSAADGASADAGTNMVQFVGVTVTDLVADNFVFV